MVCIVQSRFESNTAKAFLRWIGGKRLLVHRLVAFLPTDLAQRKYHEPFAGAANLFFRLAPKRAVLSDLNHHLIECYRHVRDAPENVAAYLREHEKQNSESYYYRIRNQYNRSKFSIAQAGRFIYLNQTCFNGIFRVNTDGAFNVPYGDKPNPAFPTPADLASASKALKHASLHTADYETALCKVGKSDFVYLDPPYPPLNGTSFFTHYTPDRFGENDQERLAAFAHDLDHQGSLFLMTNADLPRIKRLYSGFHVHKLAVTRYVSANGHRHRVGELVITNYKPIESEKTEHSEMTLAFRSSSN